MEMLILDFVGQQNRLANHQPGTVARLGSNISAGDLAKASFEKVFPLETVGGFGSCP